MSRSDLLTTRILAAAAVAILLSPQSALACAACFGKSDSALAQGMNMGIFSLLAVIVGVLFCVAGFFIFLARRSAKVSAAQSSVPVEESNESVLQQ